MVIENSEKKFTAIYLTCLGVPEHTSTCVGQTSSAYNLIVSANSNLIGFCVTLLNHQFSGNCSFECRKCASHRR